MALRQLTVYQLTENQSKMRLDFGRLYSEPPCNRYLKPCDTKWEKSYLGP